jgi:hypothetical protein
MRRVVFLLAIVVTATLAVPSIAAAQAKVCNAVGGVLMTNIGAIGGEYNLGPVFGDLAGSVAANVIGASGGTFTLQHYWITSTGETILFKPAVLHPTFPTEDTNIVAVPWGNYISEIKPGGTGKYANATGYLTYFGMADFNKLTLVLRYQGQVCIPVTDTNPSR